VTRLALCADFGSTFTKVLAIDLDRGRLLGTAEHRTTIDTDVLDGLTAAQAELGVAGPYETTLACSSAGGGLRLAVVGYERVVSAEAGRRVALSAGARVVQVTAGALDDAGVRDVRASRPDVVLLVGGTDGGDTRVILHNADRIARAELGIPVVVAGNLDAQEVACGALRTAGTNAIACANVLPDIGEIAATPARLAIRQVFLSHVIAGKRLSAGPAFVEMVRAATPDAVLAGVELLADELGSDLLVVDVGGATTDVYSVVLPQGEDAALRREVVQPMWRGRTVEGDLGMRWGATGTVEAAAAERLPVDDTLRRAAQARVADPGWVPQTPAELADDRRLATLAATVAVRRHARPADDGSAGKDLRAAVLLIGSGGVLRHADPAAAQQVLGAILDDARGGWQRPEHAVSTVDTDYVLAAAGLLAESYPDVGRALLRRYLVDRRH